MISIHRIAKLLAAVIVVGMAVGCARTQQAEIRPADVNKTGFLGDDYALLQPGRGLEPQLVWINPQADAKAYDKLLLPPIVYFRDRNEWNEPAYPQAEMTKLLDNTTVLLHRKLSPYLRVVSEPSPGTVRMQVALVDVRGGYPGLDLISTVVPTALAVATLKQLATGKAAFVGEASYEVKITDAVSGTLLGVAVDRRAGGKSLGKDLNTWADAQNIIEYWTDRAGYRWCVYAGRSDCRAPN
jgi:hypothetical protein